MGRSHDAYCPNCECYFSLLVERQCPGCGHFGFYDINYEAEELAPDGRPWWKHWEEERAVSSDG
jgi:hypothetical protein